MGHRIASAVFLITSLVIALGAAGHAHQWSVHVQPALGALPAQLVRLLELVWFWVSGAMAVFGVLLVWAWRRIARRERALYPLPWVIGIFYLIEGVFGAWYLGAFFSVFIVLALLLFASTWVLQREPGLRT